MRSAKLVLKGSMIAVLLLTASPLWAGTVSANFTDGNDNTAPTNPGINTPTADSFKGAAGAGGWTNAWGITTTGTVSSNTTQVLNTSELTLGGGNYLQTNYTGSGGATVHTIRQYNPLAGGGVDTTKEHTISFQFRLDSPVANRSLTDTNDFIRFFDNNSAAGTGGTATSWQIIAGGVSGQTGGEHFRFLSGDGVGAGGQVTTDTGILLASNVVFTISVTVHPTAGTFNVTTNFPTWDATISDGTSTFTQTGLRFRDNAITSGRFLQFGSGINAANEVLQYSLDSINIVPEPTGLALSVAAAGLVGLRRRRR